MLPSFQSLAFPCLSLTRAFYGQGCKEHYFLKERKNNPRPTAPWNIIQEPKREWTVRSSESELTTGMGLVASMRRVVRWPTSRYTLAGLSLAYKGQEEQTFIQNHGAAVGFCFI